MCRGDEDCWEVGGRGGLSVYVSRLDWLPSSQMKDEAPSTGGVADLDVGAGDRLPDRLGVVDLSVG